MWDQETHSDSAWMDFCDDMEFVEYVKQHDIANSPIIEIMRVIFKAGFKYGAKDAAEYVGKSIQSKKG